MEVQTVGTPGNQAFYTGTVPIVVGVLNPVNSPQSVWDCGTAYEFASITTAAIGGSPTSFTILLQGSLDGVIWTTIATCSNTVGETQFSTGTVPFANLRANCTAVSGGSSPTVSIAVVAYQNAPETIPGGTTPGAGTVSGTVTSNQGTAGTAANAWPTKLVDSAGVNVATVKAASTAAAATDTSQVVSLSPNNSLAPNTKVNAFAVGITDNSQNGFAQVVASSRSNSLVTMKGIPPSTNILANTVNTDATAIVTIPANTAFFGQIVLSGSVVVAAGVSGAINATPNVTVVGTGSPTPATTTKVAQLSISVGANLTGSLSADSNSDAASFNVIVFAGTSTATLQLNLGSATAASASVNGYYL